MQILKETGVEHVRHRATNNIKPPAYQEMKNFLLQPHIRKKASVRISEDQPLAVDEGQIFCTSVWQTGLKMMQDIRDTPEDARKDWRPLTSRQCPTILKKYKQFVPPIIIGNSTKFWQLLINLAKHHPGELVELHSDASTWVPVKGPCPTDEDIWEQFLCGEKSDPKKSRANGAQRSLASKNMRRHVENQLQTGANRRACCAALPPSPWQAYGISGERWK